jgi:hypothetical protein
MGTGQTKGRWRNPVNCEEVLSDALQQAGAELAGNATLQDAWIAAKPEADHRPRCCRRAGRQAVEDTVTMSVPPSRMNSKTAPATLAKTPNSS